VKKPALLAALTACFTATLAACTAIAPRHSSVGPAIAHDQVQHAHGRPACLLGRLLPHNEAIAIDYVDFVQFEHRNYIASRETANATQLRQVVAHVRCSLIAEENQRRGAPPMTNLTASFLARGTALYRLRGYSPRCRLAAYLHGRLQAYLAQTTVHGQTAPVRCALRHRTRHHR
jgi:hypothetical protein